MKYLISILLLTTSTVILAQKSPLLIKAYYNAEFEGDDITMRSFRAETSGVGRMTLAVHKGIGRKFYAEVELSNFTFRRENEFDLFSRSRSSRHTHDVGFRFEMGTTLLNRNRHSFQLGMAIKPRFRRIQDRTGATVLRTTREYLFTSAIIPRFNYKLSEVFFLDVNAVLDFFHLVHLNEKEMGSDTGESILFPASIGLRVGLVYRI